MVVTRRRMMQGLVTVNTMGSIVWVYVQTHVQSPVAKKEAEEISIFDVGRDGCLQYHGKHTNYEN